MFSRLARRVGLGIWDDRKKSATQQDPTRSQTPIRLYIQTKDENNNNKKKWRELDPRKLCCTLLTFKESRKVLLLIASTSTTFAHYAKQRQPEGNTIRQHKLAVQELSDRATKIIKVRDDARCLPKQIKHLSPHGPWQGKIYELIGRAVMEEDCTLVERAQSLQREYKRLERISLLELAVWKFACLTKDQNDGDRKSFVEWTRWYENGWKEHKKSHYWCNQVVILMKAIVPFVQDQKKKQQQPIIESDTDDTSSSEESWDTDNSSSEDSDSQ